MITLLSPRVGVFVSNCYSIIMQRFGFSFALELRRLRKKEPATSSPVSAEPEDFWLFSSSFPHFLASLFHFNTQYTQCQRYVQLTIRTE